MLDNKPIALNAALISEIASALHSELAAKIVLRLATKPATVETLVSDLGIPTTLVEFNLALLLQLDCALVLAVKDGSGKEPDTYGVDFSGFFARFDWSEFEPFDLGGFPEALTLDSRSLALQVIATAAAESIKAGYLGSDQRAKTLVRPVAVDDTGWDEVEEALEQARERIAGAGRESTLRSGSGSELQDILIGLVAFRAPAEESLDQTLEVGDAEPPDGGHVER